MVVLMYNVVAAVELVVASTSSVTAAEVVVTLSATIFDSGTLYNLLYVDSTVGYDALFRRFQ